MKQRDYLAGRTVVALIALWFTVAFAPAGEMAPREFVLKETAGLARFGYPVHVDLPLELGSADPHFRLKWDGRDVPAQFRRVARLEDGLPCVVLDFNASPGPFQLEKYTVERNPVAKAAEEERRGMTVRQEGSIIHISHVPYIDYSIADDLAGLVRSVRIPAAEFIKEGSQGLYVVVKGRKTPLRLRERTPRSIPIVRATRQGPLAVGLQAHEPLATPGAEKVVATIDLTFPSSKSWIETVWTLDDPLDQVEGMGVDLALQLDTMPALVDCGAKSTVYATLKRPESLIFEAGQMPSVQAIIPSWVVRRDVADRSQVLAAMERKAGNEPEGWIHVMDQKRCTAMAVADFGRAALATIDRFDIHGTGRLDLERGFRTEKTGQKLAKIPIKTLRFWLHFVPNPVQVSALTSPQAMLAPLEVNWSPSATPASDKSQ